MNQRIEILNDEKINLQPYALYIYQGFQVIEAYNDEQNDCYYLFFYKDQFLTAKKTLRIKRISTLKQILTKGIHIPNPNPIINTLISANSIKTLPTIDSIWKKVNKSYPKNEALHVLTLFNNYLKKERIQEIIKNTYYELRREGKLLHAYQILVTILQSSPTNKWAKSIISNVQYMKYSTRYSNGLDNLITIDPLYAENMLYQQLDSLPSISLLVDKLHREHRTFEQIALFYYLLTKSEYDIDVAKVFLLLSRTFSEEESTSFFISTYNQSNSSRNKASLFKHLLSTAIRNGQTDQAYRLITSHNEPLSVDQINMFIQVIEKLNSTYPIDFTCLKADLLRFANYDQTNTVLSFLLPRLFANHNIEFIYQWLEPFHYQRTSLPVIEKLKTMYMIKDDPDQQHYMGELYYELRLLPQAIDCFNWDFELNPTNARPLKWLTKLYRELGMVEESKSYQYLFQQMQKGS